MVGEPPGTALVTGAAGGIGSAVVRLLVERGFAVAALDVDGDGVADLAARLAARGHRVRGYAVDVADADAVEAAVAAAESDLGALAAAVNVAGVLRWGPVTAFSDRQWREVFDVNTLGVFHVCRAAARAMVPRQSGSIVTVGSDAGAVPRAAMAAYAASKAAAAHFTLSLGLELAPHGIRCNVVSPGATDTAMQRALWDREPAPATQPAESAEPAAPAPGARAEPATAPGADPRAFRVAVPLGRIAQPDDVAESVAFLISPAARHITLHDLRVDGGASLGA
ncbi:SDR family NAD(P)-dependent oxidoreductase [Streptomonospora sp. S1-112]|uniref:SDR family NAD(P)-dependent oxidoreductase n=1 Tax=Streptomonospora mangrovi TaxID=2883123 RepID=A0A9X3NN25_9ACTN|nr:SDR family NAD(P)-dependent oxidoreductase [Streptomonospora mangrovi]MDA0566303.1 SDR family NAD(P)-dependent oxidoreductase [Streptomonospora mangrovi]